MKNKPEEYRRTRSQAHFERASSCLPLGVSSVARYWGKTGTLYVSHGKGDRVWDIDGNEYIDYRLGFGAAILGHCDPRVDEAARQGMEKGGVFGLSTEAEYRVARQIGDLIPSAEMVSFCGSGTAAVALALRLGRAFSGKSGFVLFEGGFHGSFDEGLRDTDLEGWDGTGEPAHAAYSEGIPEVLDSLVWEVPMNDPQRLEDLLKKHSDEIGVLLLEPIQGNACAITAEPQFLRDLRELCDQYDVVLVADEVKTGFRVAPGGAQELLGFRADLCTLGKSMGNGYPIAALAGREEIMRKLGDTVHYGGTYNGHCLSLAAAENALDIIATTDALKQVERYGARLRDGISDILRQRDIPHVFSGHPGLSVLFFAPDLPRSYRDWKDSDYVLYHLLVHELSLRGVMVEPDSLEPWYTCAAHNDGSIQQTLEAFEPALEAALELRPRADNVEFCKEYFRKHIPEFPT